MDEQMFCFQCEQAAGCTACTGAAGVCGKSAETAAAQDRLTGALIAFAGQLIAAGRGPAPEQARLLMQGLFTTITNVNFDPAAVDALTRRVHDASPGTGPDYDMQALWREPDADRRSLKCFVLFSLRGMAAYNYHARVLGRIDPELDRFFCTALQAVGDPGQTTDALWQLVQATGEASYRCMELLDAANTGAFGDPEPVQVPLTTAESLPAPGREGTVYTVMNVTENDVSLYGFATEEQRSCFKMLTSVSGVGPKAGLAILSIMTPERVALAASSGDHKAFTKANGVGPKLAQRIALELKDKVGKGLADGTGFGGGAAAAAPAPSSAPAQAVAALVALGYNTSDAAAAVARIDETLPVQDIIKIALRGLSRA